MIVGMTTVQGSCEAGFEGVGEALGSLVEQGKDVGCSAAVVHEGKLVADFWAGHADEARTQEWERDTITNVWSTTKTMTNLSALILADQGALDVDAPVKKYWPEFVGDTVLVRHLLSHTAGKSGWDEPITVETLYDWDKACSLLAAQEPWWEPGTASGYHAITQGNLVGEVIRRVTGQTVGTWFAENVAGPLDADFHIGTPPDCDDRVSPVIPPPPLSEQMAGADPNSIAMRTFLNPPMDATYSHSVEWRRAEIPAAGGHGNARSVATIQSIVSGQGETFGKRFMSKEGCDRIFNEQSAGMDLVLGVDISMGIGYGLPGSLIPLNPHTCFWGGWGGSLVINDLDAHLTVAYVMNRMGDGTLGDDRAFSVVLAAYGAIGNA